MQFKDLTIYVFVMTVVLVLLYSCASTGKPSGGPKDTDPPLLDTARSTLNMQVRFQKQDMVFYFDEFVEVKDIFKQVVISPPLTYLPEIESRGKRVTLKFGDEEVLKKDATYTINFGDAIRDFRQGNILKNFKMVFSTGDFIDSLSVGGKVKDAFSGEPVEDVVVMLYDDGRDSIMSLEKPFYFTRTDKNGSFRIENIKEDTFKLFALKDENLNYIYDLETERIGFLDSLFILNDSSAFFFNMELFKPEPELRVISMDDDDYGKIVFMLNTINEDILVKTSEPKLEIIQELSEDSLLLFYETLLDSFEIYIAEDTFQVRVPSKSDYEDSAKLTVIPSVSPQKVSIAKKDTVNINFNRPIQAFNIDSIYLQDTSLQKQDVRVELEKNARTLNIVFPWKEGADYILTMLKSAVTDINGLTNDTLIRNIDVYFQDKLGTIHASYNALDSGYTYIAILEKGGKPIRQDKITVVDSKISYTDLLPGDYQITTIRDENKNGRWDPGSYWNKTKSEKIRKDQIEKLRANWELDATIFWDPLAKISVDSNETSVDSLQQSNPSSVRKDQKGKGKK